MLKRSELGLVLGVTAVLAAAAILGTATAPQGMSLDPRLSTRLTSPNGARAFRTLLERFGVNVGERLRPFFDLDRTRTDPRVLLMVARPIAPLTTPEVRAVRGWVASGGRLLLAGPTGIERCFGYQVRGLEFTALAPWMPGRAPQNGETLPEPRPRATLQRADREGGEDDDAIAARRRCEVLAPAAADVLWTRGQDTSAVRLRFASHGEVVLVADGSVFSNRSLRATDAGVLVLGWVLDEVPRTVLVDEYHQGFGRARSLPGSVLAWAFDAPAGWMVIQLMAAGLFALALAAVRFGPAVPAVERRRRSPLEHLDALGAGLERSGAALTATRLIASGLRRRLGGSPLRAGDTAAWLETLEASAQLLPAREAAGRLRRRVRDSTTGSDVRAAADAVEDLWQILKVPTRTPS